MAIPVNNKTAPPTLVMINVYFLKFLEKSKNFCIKNPDKINGIASPNE